MIRTTASCLGRGRAPAKLMWVHSCNMWFYFDGNYWMLLLLQMFAHWHWLMVGRLWPTPVQHPFRVRARTKVHCYHYYISPVLFWWVSCHRRRAPTSLASSESRRVKRSFLEAVEPNIEQWAFGKPIWWHGMSCLCTAQQQPQPFRLQPA